MLLPKFARIIATDLETSYYPLKPIVPYLQTVHDRAVMEIFRGCIHGCRFCQAGQVYKPVRYRSKETVMAMCEELMKNTGYDEISFTSLSRDDYPWLEELMTEFHEKFPDIAISLPSLRCRRLFLWALWKNLPKAKKSGLTFAQQKAGTQRLRDVINKGLTEEGDPEWTSACLFWRLGPGKTVFHAGIADRDPGGYRWHCQVRL